MADYTGYPKYGPGVVGKEAFDKSVVEWKSGSSKYGPGLRQGTEYGPGVAPPTEEPAEAPTDAEVAALSVRELSELLKADSGLTEQLLEAELARPEGARKSALREIAKAERQRESPDKGLLDRVEANLELLEG